MTGATLSAYRVSNHQLRFVLQDMSAHQPALTQATRQITDELRGRINQVLIDFAECVTGSQQDEPDFQTRSEMLYRLSGLHIFMRGQEVSFP